MTVNQSKTPCVCASVCARVCAWVCDDNIMIVTMTHTATVAHEYTMYNINVTSRYSHRVCVILHTPSAPVRVHSASGSREGDQYKYIQFYIKLLLFNFVFLSSSCTDRYIRNVIVSPVGAIRSRERQTRGRTNRCSVRLG